MDTVVTAVSSDHLMVDNESIYITRKALVYSVLG